MNKNSMNVQNSTQKNTTQSRKFLFIGLAVICSIALVIIYNTESPESKTNLNSTITQSDNALPADFNPINYLHLNPDLQTAAEKMTSDEEKTVFAKNHYEKNGKKEGRKYKKDDQ